MDSGVRVCDPFVQSIAERKRRASAEEKMIRGTADRKRAADSHTSVSDSTAKIKTWKILHCRNTLLLSSLNTCFFLTIFLKHKPLDHMKCIFKTFNCWCKSSNKLMLGSLWFPASSKCVFVSFKHISFFTLCALFF